MSLAFPCPPPCQTWLPSDAPQEYGPIPWPLQWYTSYYCWRSGPCPEVPHMGGKHAGNVVFIPRITLEPSEESLPIPLSHCQFPVHVAFAMTINKSQGQSVTHVGLTCALLSFHMVNFMLHCHAALQGRGFKVLFPEGSQASSTLNVVYPEVLLNVLPTLGN